jgi:nucleotide-binding universal stress UspA family protein
MIGAVGAISYEMIAHDLENQLAARLREVDAYDLKPKIVVENGKSIYEVILGTTQEEGVDLSVVGSHRPMPAGGAPRELLGSRGSRPEVEEDAASAWSRGLTTHEAAARFAAEPAAAA